MIKKLISIFTVLVFATIIAGCSNTGSENSSDKKDVKKDTVALVFPKNAKEHFDSLTQMLKDKDFDVKQFEIDDYNSINQDDTVKKLSEKGYRFLIVDVINRSQLNSSLDKIRGQGTNILGYDNIVFNIGAPDVNITFDYLGDGQKDAERFIKENNVEKLKKGEYKTVELFAPNALVQSNYDYFRGVMNILQPYLDNGKVKVLSKKLPQSNGDNISEIATINNNQEKMKTRLNNLLDTVYSEKELNGIILGPTTNNINIDFNSQIKVYNTNRSENDYLNANKFTISIVLALKAHANIDSIEKVANGKRAVPTVYVY
jgi:putative multiple sugar transport system substrate-binding protein